MLGAVAEARSAKGLNIVAKSLGIRSYISRKGTKYAHAVVSGMTRSTGRVRGVAYCTSDAATAKRYGKKKGTFIGKGATCEAAKKAAKKALSAALNKPALMRARVGRPRF